MFMRTSFIILHLVSLVTLSASAVCDSLKPAIPVGVITPLSGDFTRYGEKVRTGILSVDAENLNWIFEDEGCKPAAAVAAFQKLLHRDGVKFLIGPGCGSPQVSIAGMLSRAQALAILGNSAPERVFKLSNGNMLSVQHSVEGESAYNASQAFARGARRAVILFMESDFGRAHEESFRSHFKGRVIETLTYASDPTALRAMIPRIAKLSPDILYVPDAAPLMHGLAAALKSGMQSPPQIHGVYSFQSQDILDAVAGSGEGIIFSYPRIAGDALEHFPALAAKLLSAAVAACKDPTVECVRGDLLKQNSFNQQGVLEGDIGLKTIRDGQFVWIN